MKRKSDDDFAWFRLTCVGKSGATRTAKIQGWSKAYQQFQALKRLAHLRYAVVVDISDRSETYWHIRGEYWCKSSADMRAGI